MKRRIIILASTFVAIMAAFGLYRLIAVSDIRTAPRPMREDGGEVIRYASSDNLSGRGFEWIGYDEKGENVEMIFRTAAWDKLPDGSYVVIKPTVLYMQADGQRAEISADRGNVYAEEMTDGGLNVRRGSLTGNIRISLEVPPDNEWVSGQLKIYTDDIEFNNDLLRVETDSRVELYSDQVDVAGRGLLMSWNDLPRELRMLRIEHGECMIARIPGGQADMFALPGSSDRENLPTTAPATMPATRPTTVPSSALADVTRASTTTPASVVEKLPPSKREPRNVFRATFGGRDIHVDSPRIRMEGMQELTLTFQLDRSKGEKKDKGKDKPEAVPTVAPAPGTGQSSAPNIPPTAPTPAEPPADKSDAAYTEVLITWDGPLVIKPIGYEKELTGRRTMLAKGREILLYEKDTKARCTEFHFQSPEQTGWLKGTKGSPVKLTRADDVIAGRKGADTPAVVKFGARSRLVKFVGSGYMSRPTKSKRPADANTPASAASSGLSDRITWTDSLDATFGEREVTGDDGKVESEAYIEKATFHGDVTMTEAGSDDSTRSDHLDVFMAEGTDKPYPSRAVARGNVLAIRDGTELYTDKATIQFRQLLQATPDGMAPTVKPTELLAEGNVHLDNEAEDVHLVADHLKADLLAEVITIKGSGTINGVTRTDLEGRELDQPRPIKISWEEQLEFFAKDKVADILGAATFQSNDDQMRGDKMRIWFEDLSKDDKSDADGEDDSGKSRFDMSQWRRQRMRITVVRVEDNVNMTRLVRGDDGKTIVQRQILDDCEHLVYDARRNGMDVIGGGTFQAEDYNPPAGKDEKAQNGEAGGSSFRAETPWQTMFKWSRGMRLSMGKPKAQMTGDVLDEPNVIGTVLEATGDVLMVHRSGDKLVLLEQLRHRYGSSWPEKLPEGRAISLECEKLLAKFAGGDDAAESQPKGKVDFWGDGTKVGPLEFFKATGSVALANNNQNVTGQQLEYDRSSGSATIFGYLVGHPVSNARVTYKDALKGTFIPFASPVIQIEFRDGDIVRAQAKRVIGGGGT